MFWQEIKANTQGSRKDLKVFGWMLGMVLIIVGVFFLWKDRSGYFLFLGGVVFILFGHYIPIVLKPLYILWMVLGVILGWLTSKLILFMLFYGMFTLIGFIAKLFGKQFLNLNIDKARGSYWEYRKDLKLEKINKTKNKTKIDKTKIDKTKYERQF